LAAWARVSLNVGRVSAAWPQEDRNLSPRHPSRVCEEQVSSVRFPETELYVLDAAVIEAFWTFLDDVPLTGKLGKSDPRGVRQEEGLARKKLKRGHATSKTEARVSGEQGDTNPQKRAIDPPEA
jgi:hypothetical protein